MKACPVDGCDARISATMLMCRTHWYLVPKDLRDDVWRTYRMGAGVFDEAYHDAADAAIAVAEQRQAA